MKKNIKELEDEIKKLEDKINVIECILKNIKDKPLVSQVYKNGSIERNERLTREDTTMLTKEDTLKLKNDYMINMDHGYGIFYDPGIPEDMIEDFIRDVEKLILSKIKK